MQNIRTEIPKVTKFYFVDTQAEVISGKQEGININYKFLIIN